MLNTFSKLFYLFLGTLGGFVIKNMFFGTQSYGNISSWGNFIEWSLILSSVCYMGIWLISRFNKNSMVNNSRIALFLFPLFFFSLSPIVYQGTYILIGGGYDQNGHFLKHPGIFVENLTNIVEILWFIGVYYIFSWILERKKHLNNK